MSEPVSHFGPGLADAEPPYVPLASGERTVWHGRPAEGGRFLELDRWQWHGTWPWVTTAGAFVAGSVLATDTQIRWCLAIGAILLVLAALWTFFERHLRRRRLRFALTNLRAIVAEGRSRVVLDLAEIRHLLVIPGRADSVVLSTGFEGEAAAWTGRHPRPSRRSGRVWSGPQALMPPGVSPLPRTRLVFEEVGGGESLVTLIRQLRADLT